MAVTRESIIPNVIINPMSETQNDGDLIAKGGMGEPMEIEQRDPRQALLSTIEERAHEIVALLKQVRTEGHKLSQMSDSQLKDIAQSLDRIEGKFSLEKLPFRDFIKEKSDQPMTPEEAIEVLASYHETTPENVVAAFKNLQGFKDGYVIFKLSRKYSHGITDISMREVKTTMNGYTVEGGLLWYKEIDHNGNPVFTVS